MRRWSLALTPALLAVMASAALAAGGQPDRHASLPAVSPNGRTIAYLRTSTDVTELRMVDTDGSGDRRVLPLDTDAALPGWGPGGKRVTITNVGKDHTSLFSLNLKGRDVKTIVRLRAKGMAASNDGKRLAYVVGSWRTSRLMVSEIGGENPRALTDSTSAWFNMAWSPDDRMLAVTHMDSSNNMQVVLVDPKDGTVRPLTALTAAEGRPQWPAWSPDGKRIAMQAGRYDRADPGQSTSDIWVYDVVSGKGTCITTRPRPWMDETPSWADNHQIVIQSSRTGRFELWRLSDDGKKAVQLTK